MPKGKYGQLRAKLESQGIQVLDYPEGDIESRQAAIDTVGDLKFNTSKNTTNEGGVRYKIGEYWHPAMTKTEIAEVRSIAKNEANKTDNYLGIDAKWLYNKEKGHEYFAIYSTMDSKVPTVMYACKDDRATLHNRILMEALKIKEETYERINADAGNLDEVLSSIEDVVSGKHQHPGSAMGTGGNNGNASVYSRNKRIRLDQAFINCLRNIEEVQKQYGLDDHYQFAADRGDMKTAQRMDGCIWLARPKSNDAIPRCLISCFYPHSQRR